VGGGALGALVVTWAGVALGLGILRRSRERRLTGPQSPIRNAEITLSLTLVILYLLALPVLLSYAVNGLLATWTLPDFAIVFIGFLSALQALFVALGGLVLAAAAAGIGWALQQDSRTVPAG
jgi:hypothetical protein